MGKSHEVIACHCMSDVFNTTKEKLFPANAHDIFIVFKLTDMLQVTRLPSMKKQHFHLKKPNRKKKKSFLW